ncbi:MAG: hypothetical protein JKY59_00840 [Emcibacter sp.]|nr:hypothetical protein [Emcibacter sp.]
MTRDPAILDRLQECGKTPKTAVKVTVKEAYFHCGKAFHRSGFWKADEWGDVSDFPIVGKIMMDMIKVVESTLEELYQKGMREELY